MCSFELAVSQNTSSKVALSRISQCKLNVLTPFCYCVIFYASIVKISESTDIFFPNGSIPVLSQFIAWLNLDLGIETCFYHGMTAYAKMWLQFCVPSLHMVHHSHHHSPVSLLHMAVQQDWRQCSAGSCYSHLVLVYKDLSHSCSCNKVHNLIMHQFRKDH